jgi:hypothetical protein
MVLLLLLLAQSRLRRDDGDLFLLLRRKPGDLEEEIENVISDSEPAIEATAAEHNVSKLGKYKF